MRLKPLFLALLGVLAISCGGSEDQREAKGEPGVKALPAVREKNHLRINLGIEPETLDPALSQSLATSRAVKGLLEGLVRLDKDAKGVPAMAERWEHDGTYTNWTFHLRKDAKWTNGDPVTAHDFVYAIQRVMTPETAAPYAQNVVGFIRDGKEYFDAGGLKGTMTLEGAKALDDHTLRLELVGPTPFFDSLVDLSPWYPVHRPTVEKYGLGWDTKPEQYVGNGPFKIVAYRSKDRIEAVKSPTYWDRENIHWEKVTYFMIESLPTEDRAFMTGDLDITGKVDLARMDFWRSRPEFRGVPIFGTYYITFNNQRPPFNDARVRQAFSMVIDRDLLVNKVTRRGDTVVGGLVPDWLPSVQGGTWRDHAGPLQPPRDIQKAKALLAEAGYPDPSRMPQIEYMYDVSEEHKQIGEQLQNMWRSALGVDVRLQQVDWSIRLQNGRSGNFQILRTGWYGDYMDAMTFIEIFETGNGINNAQFSNPRYDEIVRAVRREGDAVARERLMAEAERILIQESSAIAPLFVYSMPVLIRTDIEGVELNPTGDIIYYRARRK